MSLAIIMQLYRQARRLSSVLSTFLTEVRSGPGAELRHPDFACLTSSAVMGSHFPLLSRGDMLNGFNGVFVAGLNIPVKCLCTSSMGGYW